MAIVYISINAISVENIFLLISYFKDITKIFERYFENTQGDNSL